MLIEHGLQILYIGMYQIAVIEQKKKKVSIILKVGVVSSCLPFLIGRPPANRQVCRK